MNQYIYSIHQLPIYMHVWKQKTPYNFLPYRISQDIYEHLQLQKMCDTKCILSKQITIHNPHLKPRQI